MFDSMPLDRRLQLGLDAMAITEPTEVQRRVIPAALDGTDLLISAETGSGKTLAYVLPLAQKILAAPTTANTGALALILVPTRELARQVLKHCQQLLVSSPINAQSITGGEDFKYQRSVLRKNPEIIVGTPGRILEHCQQGSMDLTDLQTLVLDEADRMLDLGFRDDVSAIAARCSPQRQVLMLSATLRHKGLGAVAGELLQTPKTIAVGAVRQAHSSIFHQVILADNQGHKDKLLAALLHGGGYRRALVFANKRSTAQRLAGLMRYHGLRCDCLHGELSTEERKAAITRLNDGKVDVVCASDVAARGLDVPGIDLVVNYDMPHSGDDYLHRSGRTGRAAEQGLAISLVNASEWNLMISIQRYLKLTFEQRALPGLKAKYSGPKKQKKSGKAAGSNKKRDKSVAEKNKTRHRNRKSKGKPHSPDPASTGNDGFAPLMKKKPSGN